jgi:Protein of unknown function (DUF1353)
VSRFLTNLDVEMTSDTANEGRGEWVLTQALQYQSDLMGAIYTVPIGFATDFASVPRVPIAFLLAGDTASRPAALHDWLYTYPHPVALRSQADALLKEAAKADGVPAWRAWLLWAGVRLGGDSHWAIHSDLGQKVSP